MVDGTHALGPEAGRLLVRTGRTGLGSRAGHDLTIEVTRWSGTATVDAAEPGNSSVNLDAEVGSFEVREGTGGVKPLTDADRREIVAIVREKVLRADRHPTVTFRSTSVAGNPQAFTVEGDLTVAGVTRPVTVRGRLDGTRATGEATVVQSHHGIKPYSAFLGALRVADEVGVEFDVDLTG